MSADAQFGKAAMVTLERVLPGPIERVWEFLTTPERLPAWFGNGTIEPREGGTINFLDGHIRGVVTQWKPPRRLAYTWNVFSPEQTASSYPESYLTIELEPRGDQVHLTLRHLPVLDQFETRNAMGWHTFLDLIEAALRGEPHQDRKPFMERNARRYGVDLSNLVR